MMRPSFGIFSTWKVYKWLAVIISLTALVFAWLIFDVNAFNIGTYSDTLSDSTPDDLSNHTLQFTLQSDVLPGDYIDLVPPPGFSILATSTSVSSSTFTARNVELYVNGLLRPASSTGGVATDTVSITYGSPGLIRYTLNPTTGISNGDTVRLLIGSNAAGAHNGGTTYSTTTGTTTLSQDIGILNGPTTGSHEPSLTIMRGASRVASADFKIFLIEEVTLGPADTTETVPPFRFNGAPSGNVGGTTLSIELSVETDEFADCNYATSTGITYSLMTNTFEGTGLIVHTQLVAGLMNNATYTYYIRCIDDEGNFNTDDYEITFHILEVASGTPNTTGSSTGDGTGSGDDGSSSGSSGSGGSSGGGSGGSSGGSSGTGGSGGGGGGGSGSDSGSTAGGGFENSNAPYRSGDARVIINGYAFPNSDIVALVDGQIASTNEQTDSQGKFSVTLDEIARGVYTFGVYAVDDNGVKSTTFSTSFSVQGARTSVLSNINIMPSILVTPDPVDIGQTVTFTGFSIPDATLTIENLNDKSNSSLQSFTTTSGSGGDWSLEVDTTGFSQGTYKVRAKAEQTAVGGVETDFSDYTYYGVGQEAENQINADLNRDGRVNLVDFSILLFHWGTDGGTSDPPADINRDGNVSLTDFSIMLFNWTG